jgi:hypothetical protein
MQCCDAKKVLNRSALALTLLLVGCGHTEELRVKEVPVPPVIEVPERPLVPKGTPESEIFRATMDYILVLEGKLKEAIIALEVYRK